MAMTAWAAKFFTRSICLVGKRPHLLAVNDDAADQLIILEHRYDSSGRARSSSATARRLRLLRRISAMWATCFVARNAPTGARIRGYWTCGAGIRQTQVGAMQRQSRMLRHRNGTSCQTRLANRVAFSSIALNTGANSPGELLITFSTSDVAACCSSASFSLCSSSAIRLGCIDGGRLAMTSDLRRIAALQRLRALRFCCFAACFVAPSHCLPRGSGQGIVSTRGSTLKGVGLRPANVSFGSKADMCSANRHVRFTPDCDGKSRHRLTGRMLLKATLIYRRTGNLRAVRLLLGHTKMRALSDISALMWTMPSRLRSRSTFEVQGRAEMLRPPSGPRCPLLRSQSGVKRTSSCCAANVRF